MKIEVVKIHPKFLISMCHVLIDGLHVGTGTEKECNALADELREDETKARLVYDLCNEPQAQHSSPAGRPAS